MSLPEDVQNLICEKSFAVAYKSGNYRVAKNIRKTQPIFLQFRFPTVPEVMEDFEDEEDEELFYKSCEVDICFDGTWKYHANHGTEKWMCFNKEKVFKKHLLKILNWAIISSQSKRSETHVTMRIFLTYASENRFQSMKLKDYKECSGINMEELDYLLNMYIESPDTLLPVNQVEMTYFVKSCGYDKYNIRNRHLMVYKENNHIYTAEIFAIDFKFYIWKKHFMLNPVQEDEEDFIMFNGSKMVHPLKYTYSDCVELLKDLKMVDKL